MNDTTSRVVSVLINGRQYAVRSVLDEAYVSALAAYVHQKMQHASEELAEAGDPSSIAVLAALNIADELFRCQQDEQLRSGELRERAIELERLVDRALALENVLP